MKGLRYFGFDLGDGESCVALYSQQQMQPVILPVCGQTSFMTALGKLGGKTVVGALASDNPQTEDLHVCFKRNFCRGDQETEEIVMAFARGVMEALQDVSIVRKVLAEEEVAFQVGCPADWSKSVRARYAQLLTRAGVPNVRIVPESRAAFLAASMSDEAHAGAAQLMDSTLVVDLGSSTLDLAYVYDGKEYTVGTMGVQLGGGMLDEMIVDYAIGLLCTEEQEVVRAVLKKQSAWKSRLMVSARKLKEQYFTQGNEQLLVKRETIFCEGRHAINLSIGPEILHQLVHQPSDLLDGQSFHSRLMNCLLMAQQMMTQRPPKVVLLTGGASRMPFFQQACQETFPQATMLVSPEPAFDIARGLACAGHVDELVAHLRDDIAEYVKSNAVEDKVHQAMPALTKRLATMMVHEMTEQVTKVEFSRWQKKETKTLADMEAACVERTERLIQSSEWDDAISTMAAPWLEDVLLDVQKDLNHLCEKYATGVQRLQIQQAIIRMGANLLPEGVPLPELPIVTVLVDVIAAAVAAAVCGGGGVALIATGPLGLIIGAAIGVLAVMLGRNAFAQQVQQLLKSVDFPRLLRQTASQQHLFSAHGQEKLAETVCDALMQDEALQNSLCTQIGKCIDQAILALTEEKSMLVV